SALPAAPPADRLLPGAAGGCGGALVLLSHRLLPCVPARAAQRTSGPNTPGSLCRRPPLVRLASRLGVVAACCRSPSPSLPRRHPPRGIAPAPIFSEHRPRLA